VAASTIAEASYTIDEITTGNPGSIWSGFVKEGGWMILQ
jgi:hypothetical protein